MKSEQGLLVPTFQYTLLHIYYILLGSRNYTPVTFCTYKLVTLWSIQEVKKKKMKIEIINGSNICAEVNENLFER